MVERDFKSTELEKFRMDNNNLESGFTFISKKTNNVMVRYFFDRGSNFLASAYNKLINGFYDTYFDRYSGLPAYEARTPQLLQTAARRVLQTINANDAITDDEILKIITGKGFIEIYPNEKLRQPKML
jgi:hypothetical protein